jgi:HSP20 family molecular chaperone IbpA
VRHLSFLLVGYRFITNVASSSPVPGTSGETLVPQEFGSGSGSEHRFIIRTDVHYDPESKVVTAMLELPGVKKADVSVTLSTSLYNRVKQVTVSGRSRPAFPLDSGHVHTVRERKFGVFTRTFAVPSDLKVRMFASLTICVLPTCTY